MTPDIVHAMRAENVGVISDARRLGLPAGEVLALHEMLLTADLRLKQREALARSLADDECQSLKCLNDAWTEYYDFSRQLDNHFDLLCERYRFSLACQAFGRAVRQTVTGLFGRRLTHKGNVYE